MESVCRICPTGSPLDTTHTHTYTPTPEACEGADMYAACAYYPVFNVALGNTRPD